jgi:putative Mn2+ efflux pump MntP
MGIVSLVFLAIALSMDSFATSIVLGLNCCNIKAKQTLRVSLFLSVTQALFPLLGWLVGDTFSAHISNYDHWIAFILLAIIGGQMVFEGFQHKQEEEAKCLSTRNLLLLAIATSIDAFIVGAGFAFLDVNIWIATIIIFLVTMMFTIIGFTFSSKVGGKCGKFAEVVGGIILITIGVKVLIEHLFYQS